MTENQKHQIKFEIFEKVSESHQLDVLYEFLELCVGGVEPRTQAKILESQLSQLNSTTIDKYDFKYFSSSALDTLKVMLADVSEHANLNSNSFLIELSGIQNKLLQDLFWASLTKHTINTIRTLDSYDKIEQLRHVLNGNNYAHSMDHTRPSDQQNEKTMTVKIERLPLGIVLRPNLKSRGAFVEGVFNPSIISPRRGARLLSVNQKEVGNFAFAAIAQQLKSLDTPITLTFSNENSLGAENADLMTLMLGRDFHQVLPTNILPQFHNSIALMSIQNVFEMFEPLHRSVPISAFESHVQTALEKFTTDQLKALSQDLYVTSLSLVRNAKLYEHVVRALMPTIQFSTLNELVQEHLLSLPWETIPKFNKDFEQQFELLKQYQGMKAGNFPFLIHMVGKILKLKAKPLESHQEFHEFFIKANNILFKHLNDIDKRMRIQVIKEILIFERSVEQKKRAGWMLMLKAIAKKGAQQYANELLIKAFQ